MSVWIEQTTTDRRVCRPSTGREWILLTVVVADADTVVGGTIVSMRVDRCQAGCGE